MISKSFSFTHGHISNWKFEMPYNKTYPCFMTLSPSTEGFPGGSVVKNLPAMQETQETWVWSLGREGPLGEDTATHSSILVGKIPWTEEPGRLQSMQSWRVGHDWADTCNRGLKTGQTRDPLAVWLFFGSFPFVFAGISPG